MAAPSPAGPPTLRMMRSLELDEHPTHAVRDHLFTLAAAIVFLVVMVALSR
ncbi:hypothetical protein SAMN04489867_3637 [Pedococcus dokdonensis]|uniref:Uncharacterized protein n=1 Tax=Pedococcus dokdonensis TaxID=443156 RepID=A0A1H0V2Y9_9MICO|nr:hypothetical protein SAMN04489867_3637 [Pedococcus dokdonensis]